MEGRYSINIRRLPRIIAFLFEFALLFSTVVFQSVRKIYPGLAELTEIILLAFTYLEEFYDLHAFWKIALIFYFDGTQSV